MKNLSTRARIIILVVLAALPTLMVTVYGSWDERVRTGNEVREDMERLVKQVAQQQGDIIEGARHTLVALSLIPVEVRNDRGRCNEYLAKLLEQSSGTYHSIGIYGADGVLQCNANPWQGKVTAGDRLYHRLAVSSGRFAIGDYQVGRVTKKQGINFGYPIKDAIGAITAVGFLALDLGNLGRAAAAVPLPQQAVLAVLDRNGTLLAGVPPQAGIVGEKLPFPEIMDAVLAGKGGVFEAKLSDGIKRLIAYDAAAENPDGSIPIRVLVSIPLSEIYGGARHALSRDLAAILAASVLLLAGAWYGADVFMLRSIRSLLEVARQVQTGHLSARTGLAGGKDELAQLGAAFDSMASALQTREAELQRVLHELKQQAITDPLTGLHNRRFLYEVLPRELVRAHRKAAPVAAMMIDIDHFKRVNDTYGHEAGDRVLKEVSRLIKAAVRSSDISCRYGGEEIALVLPEAPLEGARLRAEAIRAAVENLEADCPGGQRVRVTISVGVAVYPEHGADADTLLRAADEALYSAKSGGRNRVSVCVKHVPAQARPVTGASLQCAAATGSVGMIVGRTPGRT